MEEHQTGLLTRQSRHLPNPYPASAVWCPSLTLSNQPTSVKPDVLTSNEDSITNPSSPLRDTHVRSITRLCDAFNRAVDSVIEAAGKCSYSYRRKKGGICGTEVVILLKDLDPLIQMSLKEAALLKSAEIGNAYVLSTLITSGVDGNCKDREQRNALHLVCKAGHYYSAYILTDAILFCGYNGFGKRVTKRPWDPKVDLEAVDVYGKTPLDYAKGTESGCEETVNKALQAKHSKKNRRKGKCPKSRIYRRIILKKNWFVDFLDPYYAQFL